MKKVLLVLVIVAVIFGIYWYLKKDKATPGGQAKEPALAVKTHTDAFNAGIDSLVNAYFAIQTALVNADSVTAKNATRTLLVQADSSRLAELKNDATGVHETALQQLADARANAESLLTQTDITEMRQDFRMVSESLYPLLKTIHYEGKTLYWQHCPMAFGEDKGANWISSTREIVNPYLGRNHPEFKGSMLHCGELKDSVQAK